MRLLKQGGYKTINIKQLVEAIKGNITNIPKRPIVITFDDGHDSFEQIGVPILQKYGFSATMFVITSKVGETGYLSIEGIRELTNEGMFFESHSRYHSILTKLSRSEQEMEIINSKSELEEITNSPVSIFSYRGGHYDDSIQSIVKEAGYISAVCSMQ